MFVVSSVAPLEIETTADDNFKIGVELKVFIIDSDVRNEDSL